MAREQQIAEAYCKLLNSIDWSDKLLVARVREGLNKFLSNAFLSLFPKCLAPMLSPRFAACFASSLLRGSPIRISAESGDATSTAKKAPRCTTARTERLFARRKRAMRGTRGAAHAEPN
jgi:hypothetical protein